MTESRLAQALAPIRGLYLSKAIHTVMTSGILNELDKGSSSAESIAVRLGLNGERTEAVLRFLAVEGVVVAAGDGYTLAPEWSDLGSVQPWYDLLVGGYLPAIGHLDEVLIAGADYATRDAAMVARGSCGISQHDALPMVAELILPVLSSETTIVDIGCGDGSFLVDLVEGLPGVRGLGIEMTQAAANEAIKKVTARGLVDRVDIRVGDGQDFDVVAAGVGKPIFILAFVLQEILEQSGRSEITSILRRLAEADRHSCIAVIEVDNREDDSELMKAELAKSYYNPYYLLHHLTRQRLMPREFWMSVFDDSGLTVTEENRPEPSYDSLGLKMGFLLRRQDAD